MGAGNGWPFKMKYKEELNRAMKMLAEKDNVFFLGQSVNYKGTGLYNTLDGISREKRIELPVVEDMQMGISIGMALEGLIPVSIYPRLDFLIVAINQMVNHLDKMEEMSSGQFKPKVIIRTAIGSVKPLFPGPQHCQDHTEAIKMMLKNIDVVKLNSAKDVFPAYKKALESDKSTLLVEIPDLYESE
jgi:pyruvate/2-oxoglutarate/acetoin dehydrogenase E1 component